MKHVEQRYVNTCSRRRRTCSMFKAVTSCNPRRQKRAACSRRQHAGIQDGNVQRVPDHFFGLAGKDMAPAFHGQPMSPRVLSGRITWLTFCNSLDVHVVTNIQSHVQTGHFGTIWFCTVGYICIPLSVSRHRLLYRCHSTPRCDQ